MGSLTKTTDTRRRLRLAKAGRAGKRARAKTGTPAFPIQPEGYNPSAPDAKASKGT